METWRTSFESFPVSFAYTFEEKDVLLQNNLIKYINQRPVNNFVVGTDDLKMAEWRQTKAIQIDFIIIYLFSFFYAREIGKTLSLLFKP